MHPDLQELCRVLSVLYLKLQNSHFSVTRTTVLFSLIGGKEIATGVLEQWNNGVIYMDSGSRDFAEGAKTRPHEFRRFLRTCKLAAKGWQRENFISEKQGIQKVTLTFVGCNANRGATCKLITTWDNRSLWSWVVILLNDLTKLRFTYL